MSILPTGSNPTPVDPATRPDIFDAAQPKIGPGTRRTLADALAQPSQQELPPPFDPAHSKLVQHARHEYELVRRFHEASGSEPPYGTGVVEQCVLELIETLARQGHSGGSLEVTLDQFMRLAQQGNLLPLTDDPAEWMDMTALGGTAEVQYQNLRNSKAFSSDGGKSYWLLDENAPHDRTPHHQGVAVAPTGPHPIYR